MAANCNSVLNVTLRSTRSNGWPRRVNRHSPLVSRLGLCVFLLSISLILHSACQGWTPPAATPEELDKGLVVMYPGVVNTTTELATVYVGLRDAKIDCAIEVVPWAIPMINFFMPTDFLRLQRPWAIVEANRIARYFDAHPGSPVTLLGYSGGAMMCILVAEELPENASVDWIIMMAPGVSTTYDLKPMLERTVRGAIVFWSASDTLTSQITMAWGTLDGLFVPAAAGFGFASKHPKLTQIEWAPGRLDGNDGGHSGYISSASWIRDIVAPGIQHGI